MGLILNEVAVRSEGENRGEMFWQNLFHTAMQCAIDLVMLARDVGDLQDVYDCIVSSPKGPKEAGSERFLKNSKCGRMLVDAKERLRPDAERRFKRAVDFFLTELSSVGMKARGAVLSMVNGTLGRLLVEPFYEALCGKTTLTPDIIESERLAVLLDYDVLTFGTPGRMFQLIWTMLCQQHCLRRDASAVDSPFVLWRDESGFFLHVDSDMKAQVIGRSQKLAHISLIQDFDVLQAALGGGEKAKHEAMAWAANHVNRVMMQSSNTELNETQSKLLGDRRTLMFGGSSDAGQPRGFIDELLGVRGGYSWHEAFEPHVRPGEFTQLRRGEAIVYLGGKRLSNGTHFARVDLWRKEQ